MHVPITNIHKFSIYTGNSSLGNPSNAKGPHNEETMVVQLWPEHPSLPPPEWSSTGLCRRVISHDLYDLCVFFQSQ